MNLYTHIPWPLIFIALSLSFSLQADDDFDAFERIDSVNEGQLSFLTTDIQGPIHHHQNHITILPDSLVSGWVVLKQCHQDLDTVPSAQIVYNRERTRALKVESSNAIDAAWVEGNTVQVQGIKSNALLCISAETRAFWPDEQGGFTLYNGPYMRQFLDGYYPMRVTLTIAYPEQLLSYRSSIPEAQPGFNVDSSNGNLIVQTLFEGRLITQLSFDHSL